MAIKSLKDFYQTVRNNGLRTNHEFQIELAGIPIGQDNFEKYIVYAQSAGMPGRTIEAQPTPFYGFDFQVPTNTKYEQTWTVTIRADKDLKTREMFEDWFDYVADLRKSTGGQKGLIPSGSYGIVHLLSPEFFNEGGSADVSRTYRLEGLFPTELGALTLDHSDNGISTFDVTLMFQYWYPTDSGGSTSDSEDPLR
jgi:hypothetical protein